MYKPPFHILLSVRYPDGKTISIQRDASSDSGTPYSEDELMKQGMLAEIAEGLAEDLLVHLEKNPREGT